ncbi:MAG TPA: Hint domain-containing protein, partial [Ramlibacter sp.]|nr:Hint domain-containing protein [Ramlibacter sp.]
TPVAAGGATNDNLLVFSGTATFAGAAPSLKIWVDVNGAGHPTAIGTASVDAATGHWTFAAPTAAADAHYAYYVTNGSLSTWDATKAVPLNGGNDPYEFDLDSVAPAKPSTVSVNDDTLTVSGHAEPASIVQIFNGDVLLTTDALLDLTTGPIITDGATGYWEYTFPASALANGHYQLNVKATDAAGNTSVASDSYSFDIQPKVSATTFTATDDVGNLPTQVRAGGYTNDSMLELSGTATILHPGSGNAPKLKIWVDSGDGNPTVFATVDVDSATGAWSISAPSLGGDAHYAFYVTDGNRSTWDVSKAVLLNNSDVSFEFNLDTVAPEKPTITSADGQTLTLSGFAEPASIVEIYNGGVLLTTPELLDATTGPIFTDGDTGYWQYTFPEGVLPAATYHFNVKATDSAGNTSLASDFQEAAVCFLKGTRLQTPGGEVAVEDLQIGDLVSTSSGDAQAIKWIGRRSYVTRFLAAASRRNVIPVRIARGALEEDVPHRDLFVSPEHAMCLHGALIPARHLVNGRSIAYCDSIDTIEYYHIELPRHEVLIAEGAVTESWLDCGNRNFFMNVTDYVALGLPDQSPTEPCLPFVKGGPLLQEVRTRLLARAAAVGFETTSDPDVHLVVDGQRINPASTGEGVYRFELPSAPATLVIGSRSATPADMDAQALDGRRLGVSLTRAVLRSRGAQVEIGHDHPLLVEGFHADEAGHRWTNGMGTIPSQLLGALAGPVQVEIHIGALATKYPNPIEAHASATAQGSGVSRGRFLRLAA